MLNYISDCDLYKGKWVHDPSGPLYTNNSCPIITQMQNCQGNGRPDKDYENWRWKPSQCDLPRLDPKKFLELMRGKTLAFIGDSVARNQMESMLCILWQVRKRAFWQLINYVLYLFACVASQKSPIWNSCSAWKLSQVKCVMHNRSVSSMILVITALSNSSDCKIKICISF